jgi:hypothetical protein
MAGKVLRALKIVFAKTLGFMALIIPCIFNMSS